ncbi:unnamed protein product [Haemonchus placei]|uniref:C2H2-type domain-containing protein n=1 Tax=Haemonchus placei TaxID=6290 RepID=A0A158QLR0_HAEPC|nr:unnamed protein product [Haemonchus placei]
MSDTDTVWCSVCGNAVSSFANYLKHLRRNHDAEGAKIATELVKERRNTACALKPYKCPFCEIRGVSKPALKRHIYRYHRKHFDPRRNSIVHAYKKEHTSQMIDCGIMARATVTCPGCQEQFRTHYDLALHCGDVHSKEDGQDFSIIQGTFPDERDFNMWMDSIEVLTKVRFIKRTSRPCRGGKCSYVFTCGHARGKGDAIDPKEMRHRFSQSKRVHSHCPAFIKITENSEEGSQELHYVACLGHLGHKTGDALIEAEKSMNKLFNNHNKHKEALRYYGNDQDMIIELENNTWAVVAEGGGEHYVEIGEPCGCEVASDVHCDRCSACSYQMKCDCMEPGHTGSPCIHCHAVATYSEKARQLIPLVKHHLASDCSKTSRTSRGLQKTKVPDTAYVSDEEMYEVTNSIKKGSPEPSQNMDTNASTLSYQTETPPCKVTKTKKQAQLEYEQLQGLEQRLDLLAKTCMLSNMPHVIREMRATIENKLREILRDRGTATWTSPKNRLLPLRQDARQKMSQSPEAKGDLSATEQAIHDLLTSAPPSEMVSEHKQEDNKEHILSRIAGFEAAVKASREMQVDTVADMPCTSHQVDEGNLDEQRNLTEKMDIEPQYQDPKASPSETHEDVDRSAYEFSSIDSELAKGPRRVLKRIYVKRGPDLLLKRVVVRPRSPGKAEMKNQPLLSQESSEDQTAKESQPDNTPKVIKRVVVRAPRTVHTNLPIRVQPTSTSSTGQNEIRFVKPLKVVERVMGIAKSVREYFTLHALRLFLEQGVPGGRKEAESCKNTALTAKQQNRTNIRIDQEGRLSTTHPEDR